MKFTTNDNIEGLPTVLRNHLPKYLSNRLKDLVALEEGVSNCDVQAISSVCHRINGTAASYGLFCLEELSREIQRLAKEENFMEVQDLVKLMRSYLDQNAANIIGESK